MNRRLRPEALNTITEKRLKDAGLFFWIGGGAGSITIHTRPDTPMYRIGSSNGYTAQTIAAFLDGYEAGKDSNNPDD